MIFNKSAKFVERLKHDYRSKGAFVRMSTELSLRLNKLLVLLEFTLNLSRISLEGQLNEQELLQIMENVAQCFNLVLDTLRRSPVVVNDSFKYSISSVYIHILDDFNKLISEENDLSESTKDRLKNIKIILESANLDESGDEYVCGFKPCL